MSILFRQLINSASTPPFGLLRREGRDHVEVLSGPIETLARLADIPVASAPCHGTPLGGTPAGDAAGPSALALVPYRQVRERGFDAVDDEAPLTCLRVNRYESLPVEDALAALPTDPPRLRGGGFDVDDDRYAETVRRVLTDEIGRGEGSNFVIHRTYAATVADPALTAALAVFARLLRTERGAYWTFLVHTGERTFVGATPERHVSVADGLVMMNPISGTYRHPAEGLDRAALLRFLADPKETDELYMVLDEELKMMAAIADLGGQVVGPYLKEMTHLTHTEYLLAGRTSRDVREVLRETMFAPTVVGSPVENACRVIARHERRGRGYYGGVLALVGRDAQGQQTLDAPILIRTVEFDGEGRVRVPVGATLVRHSTPAGEVAETYAKAAGVLTALGLAPGRRSATIAGEVPAAARPAVDVPAAARPAVDVPGDAEPGRAADPTIATDPVVQEALRRRNRTLARFWLDARDPSAPPLAPELARRRVLVVDAEDTFTGMLAHQLRALGVDVAVRSYREDPALAGYDLVVAGPGPGDPQDPDDPKMAVLRRIVTEALDTGMPLFGICLGHQVLAAALGLPLVRRDAPYQGVQREIDFFGRPERAGFYSTFAAHSPSSSIDTRYGRVRLSRDPVRGEVHALRGRTFAGVQFHPESVLTEHGVHLVGDLLRRLLGVADAAPCPVAATP